MILVGRLGQREGTPELMGPRKCTGELPGVPRALGMRRASHLAPDFEDLWFSAFSVRVGGSQGTPGGPSTPVRGHHSTTGANGRVRFPGWGEGHQAVIHTREQITLGIITVSGSTKKSTDVFCFILSLSKVRVSNSVLTSFQFITGSKYCGSSP